MLLLLYSNLKINLFNKGLDMEHFEFIILFRDKVLAVTNFSFRGIGSLNILICTRQFGSALFIQNESYHMAHISTVISNY